MMLNKPLDQVVSALASRLSPASIMEHEPLANHTTFAIGGPADVFVEPNTMEELQFVLETVQKEQVPLTVLGCGSNVLVKDGGIRGVVISLCGLKHTLRREGDTIIAGAGYTLKEVSEFAHACGLTGLEFAIGIPGSLGGAVFMNAGAYDGEMKQVVTGVRAVTLQGAAVSYDADDLDFAYRHSRFHDTHDVVGEVTLTLAPGNPETIEARMVELTEKREAKQPLEYASAGSTFKRPPGYYAGTLIDQTGLKGLSVGDAQVSKKHAGFVINTGTASASDVLGLIAEVQRRVKEAHGVVLEPEVRIIGEDK